MLGWGEMTVRRRETGRSQAPSDCVCKELDKCLRKSAAGGRNYAFASKQRTFSGKK